MSNLEFSKRRLEIMKKTRRTKKQNNPLTKPTKKRENKDSAVENAAIDEPVSFMPLVELQSNDPLGSLTRDAAIEEALTEEEALKKRRWQRVVIQDGAESIMKRVEDLNKPQNTDWLLKNRLLKKTVHVLYGASGCGKTFLALHYMMSLASQGKQVLYFAPEGFDGYAKRIRAWSKQRGLPLPKGAALYNAPLNLMDEHAFLRFERLGVKFGAVPDLVIFDTLSMCMLGGDENSSRDMSFAVNNIRLIQTRYRCSILVLHHTGKSGRGERGSSVLRGQADVMLELTKKDKILELRCTKARDTDMENFGTPRYRMEQVALESESTSCVLIPMGTASAKTLRRASELDSPQGSNFKLTENQKNILAVLDEKNPLGSAEVSALSGVPFSSTYRVLKQLEDKTMVNHQEAAGKAVFTINALGKTALTGKPAPTKSTRTEKSAPKTPKRKILPISSDGVAEEL